MYGVGGIGYTEGKTITIGSLGFSLMRFFTTHPAGNQRNWHNTSIGGNLKSRITQESQWEFWLHYLEIIVGFLIILKFLFKMLGAADNSEQQKSRHKE